MYSPTFDLNIDLFWGEYIGKRINLEDFLSDTVEMNIYGCKVKSLTKLKMMIQLMLHNYKEMNSIYHLATHDCINYNMFKDVYFLWKNNQDEISLESILAISKEYDIIPYVYYILYYTNQIFNDQKLKKYVDTLRTTEVENLINVYGLTKNEQKTWKVDFSTRLETNNMFDLIKKDLTNSDIEKLNFNRKMFGNESTPFRFNRR